MAGRHQSGALPCGKQRVYHVNDLAFSVLSGEAAYWAGFLMADGSVNRENGSIRITLHRKDEAHLRAFANFMGCPGRPLYPLGPTCFQIHFTSHPAVRDLIHLGIIPRKSYINTKARKGLHKNPNFWRGLLDGDGTISTHRSYKTAPGTPSVSLVGCPGVIGQAFRTIKAICGIAPCRQHKNRIDAVKITGERAQRLLRWMYQEDIPSLSRKHVLALEALQWRPRTHGPRSPRVTKSCKNCGKTFQVTERQANRPRAKRFCRRECSYEERRNLGICTKPQVRIRLGKQERTLAEWAREIGVGYHVMYRRWKDGKPPKQIIRPATRPHERKMARKLSEKAIREIRQLLSTGELSQRQIASRYGVSATAIRYVGIGRIGAHIPQ